MPTPVPLDPSTPPPAEERERSRAAGAQLAAELEPHIRRLHDALARARARGAPTMKVAVDDVAALFALVRLSAAATVGVDAVRRLPWHRRLLHALRDSRENVAP